MLTTLLLFAPVAVVLCLTPGPATALVVQSALTGGRRAALLTCAGNSIGILLWACAAALGVAALVTASEVAYAVLKVVGGGYLVWLGVQAWRHAGRFVIEGHPALHSRAAMRNGLITSFANPKLAVFFLALFPQFVPAGAPVLPRALAMALLLIACDVVWFSLLATLVTRARRSFLEGPWARIADRVTGTVLVGLGARLVASRSA